MNQDDVILLGELFNDFFRDMSEEDLMYDTYGNLIKKVKLIAQQAKASKDYQELMDKLNNELSEIGKEVEKDA